MRVDRSFPRFTHWREIERLFDQLAGVIGRGEAEGIYRAARQAAGSGSGLAVARAVAERLRAALEAAAPAVGEGEAGPEEADARAAPPITGVIAVVRSRRSGSK